MYVDVRDGNCANLAMQLGPAAVMGTAVVPRSWQIRVTQYDCAFDNLAPAGCTQYFFGPTSQAVQGRHSNALLSRYSNALLNNLHIDSTKLQELPQSPIML